MNKRAARSAIRWNEVEGASVDWRDLGLCPLHDAWEGMLRKPQLQVLAFRQPLDRLVCVVMQVAIMLDIRVVEPKSCTSGMGHA